jgi:hypothetical protein
LAGFVRARSFQRPAAPAARPAVGSRHDSRGHTDVAAACRPTHARGTPSKRGNVALREPHGDTAARSMSRFTRARSDMPRRACRSGSAPGATLRPLHVAPGPRVARHPSPWLSLHELGKGDMRARTRRLAQVCSATPIDDKVALPGRPKRHGERSVSPDAIVWSDLGDRGLVGPLSHGATCATAYVASLDRGERHGHARMSLQRGG